MSRNLFLYDLAYLCFAYCGITSLVIGADSYFKFGSSHAHGGIFFLVMLSMSIVALPTLGIGIGVSSKPAPPKSEHRVAQRLMEAQGWVNTLLQVVGYFASAVFA